MATIVTRAGKGSPLTNNEVDANFTNLNTDKPDGYIGTAPNNIPLNQHLGGMAYQDPDNVTIGGGSATLTSLTATTVTGTSMVYNGTELNARLNPLAQAVSVQMSASATVGGIQQLDNDNLDMGTNDFTLEFDEIIPTTRPAADIVLDRKHDGTNGYILTLRTTGVVRLQINGTTYDSTVALASATNVNPKLIIPVVRSSASAAGSVTFYTQGAILGTAVAISVGAPVSINNASPRIINGTTTTRTAGSLQASRLFNRALTAAEVLDYTINGVALNQRGATQANRISVSGSSGTFEVNATNYFQTGGTTVSRNTTSPITGVGDLRCVVPANAGSVGVYDGAANPLTAGLPYRLRFKYRVASGALRVVISNGSVIIQTLIQNLSSATAEQITVDFVANSATTSSYGIFFLRQVTTATAAEFFIDDIEIYQIGLVSELLASNAQSNTGQIIDTSGNRNHALLPASGATVVGRPVSQTREVRWTNTWAGTNELQYIGGVNQAILPANAYIESIIGTVSGATPHDIIVGDGSDTDRYVTITTGLAAGTTSFTLANRTTDGTNLKLTVDPDTNADMSIAWVITYRTLEA